MKIWAWYCVLVSIFLVSLAVILNHLLTGWTKTGKQAFNYISSDLVIANTEEIDPR